jgi:hypothetical protein
MVPYTTKQRCLETQVAGHSILYRLEEGKLCKPSSCSEISVYRAILERYPGLIPFIPRFYDSQSNFSLQQIENEQLKITKRTREPKSKVGILILEDLTHKFRSPCVMDLKLGVKMYSETAKLKRRRKMDIKSSATSARSYGFRLNGFKVIIF